MKKILTLITTLVMALAMQAEPITLWEDDNGFNPNWWQYLTLEASKFADAEVGCKLVLTIKTEADWGCYINMRSADQMIKYYESNDDDPSQEGIFGRGKGASASDNPQELTLALHSPKFLNMLKEKGLAMSGGAYNLTKVVLLPFTVNESLVPHSPKFTTGYANPLVDHTFIADPTAIEFGGRLYVYGTNDSQQYPFDISGYEHINTLSMISTDDMVNWTYHGEIPVGEIVKSCGSSWAPTIVSREESDGLTHFYLYYAHNGRCFNVLTATSPIGPWTAPLGDYKTVDNGSTYGNTFDPGATIDANGDGWVAVGGGTTALIIKLNPDMISYEHENVIQPNIQYHQEANEMNFIGGKYVYTYCLDWSEFHDWTISKEKPSSCSMVYMVSDDPFNADSWAKGYGGDYLMNPGMFGFRWGNNHTHMQKFQDKWYMIYHTCMMNDDACETPAGQENPGMGTGFRSLMIDEIEVDEKNVIISKGTMTKEGVTQIKPLNPYILQQAETTAATEGVTFEEGTETGNMIVKPGKRYFRHGMPEKSRILVRKVDFGSKSETISARLKGNGTVKVYADSDSSAPVATITVNSSDWKDVEEVCQISGVKDLVFQLEGAIEFDCWKFSDDATGINIAYEDVSTNELRFYSNNGVLVIEATQEQSIHIYSLDGRQVKNLLLNEGSNILSDLAKGIYIISNRKVVIK